MEEDERIWVWQDAYHYPQIDSKKRWDSIEYILESKHHAEVTNLRAEVERLREALSELVDWQNGRPLATYTGWDDAMNDAMRLLGRTGQRIVNGEWEATT